MIGMRFSKPLVNVEDYEKAAQWCNKNNATIEDKGDFYEVVYNRSYTEEELAARAVAEAKAKSRSILMARMQADMAQTGAFAAAEFATFAKAGLFADWATGQTYTKGYRLSHNGIVYEVMQEVTAIENQTPDAAGMLAGSLLNSCTALHHAVHLVLAGVYAVCLTVGADVAVGYLVLYAGYCSGAEGVTLPEHHLNVLMRYRLIIP